MKTKIEKYWVYQLKVDKKIVAFGIEKKVGAGKISPEIVTALSERLKSEKMIFNSLFTLSDLMSETDAMALLHRKLKQYYYRNDKKYPKYNKGYKKIKKAEEKVEKQKSKTSKIKQEEKNPSILVTEDNNETAAILLKNAMDLLKKVYHIIK